MMKAYQLKITMKYKKPPVWRRISIPAVATFAQLHDAIQCLFGFDETHLHEFMIPKLGVTISNGMLDHNSYDFMENDVSLERMLNESTRIKYCYDFGMSWEMDILVEKILNQEQPYPLLIKYKGDKQFKDDAYGWGSSFSPDFVKARLSKMVCENTQTSEGLDEMSFGEYLNKGADSLLLLSQFGIQDLLIHEKEAAYGWMWMHADISSPYLLFSEKMEDMAKHWYSKRTYDSVEDEYFEGYLIAYDERKRKTDIYEFKQGISRFLGNEKSNKISDMLKHGLNAVERIASLDMIDMKDGSYFNIGEKIIVKDLVWKREPIHQFSVEPIH